jgi:hypothetical protein
MKKSLVVLVTILAMCVTASIGLAQSDWQTVLGEAVEFGSPTDTVLMEEALQFALSNDVSLAEFLAEAKAVHPEAMGLVVATAIGAGFPAADVVTAAISAGASAGDVVAAAVTADPTAAGDVVSAALDANAPASEVVAAAVSADANTASAVVAAAISAGQDEMDVIGSAMEAGADADQVTAGATAGGMSPEAAAVAVETTQVALGYTTDETPAGEGDTPQRDTTVPVDTTPPDDVSPQ